MNKTIMVKKQDDSAKLRKRMTISISPETHRRLSEKGKYGESMDDILQRLILEAEKRSDI